MTIEEHANILLQVIAQQEAKIARLDASAADEIKAVTEKYSGRIDQLSERMRATEKELIGLMKENKTTLFDGRDQVNLTAGILLYGKEYKVSLPRDALTRAEHHSYTDAIKISKSLDRSIVETWPVERLFMIGGKKKLVEKFDYEVKEDLSGNDD